MHANPTTTGSSAQFNKTRKVLQKRQLQREIIDRNLPPASIDPQIFTQPAQNILTKMVGPNWFINSSREALVELLSPVHKNKLDIVLDELFKVITTEPTRFNKPTDIQIEFISNLLEGVANGQNVPPIKSIIVACEFFKVTVEQSDNTDEALDSLQVIGSSKLVDYLLTQIQTRFERSEQSWPIPEKQKRELMLHLSFLSNLSAMPKIDEFLIDQDTEGAAKPSLNLLDVLKLLISKSHDYDVKRLAIDIIINYINHANQERNHERISLLNDTGFLELSKALMFKVIESEGEAQQKLKESREHADSVSSGADPANVVLVKIERTMNKALVRLGKEAEVAEHAIMILKRATFIPNVAAELKTELPTLVNSVINSTFDDFSEQCADLLVSILKVSDLSEEDTISLKSLRTKLIGPLTRLMAIQEVSTSKPDKRTIQVFKAYQAITEKLSQSNEKSGAAAPS